MNRIITEGVKCRHGECPAVFQAALTTFLLGNAGVSLSAIEGILVVMVEISISTTREVAEVHIWIERGLINSKLA